MLIPASQGVLFAAAALRYTMGSECCPSQCPVDMALIFRGYAYLFELAVSLVLIVISLLAMTGDVSNLRLPMFSWEGATLAHAILGLGVLGIIVVALAITGKFRIALPVWALAVVILMFRGWFASSYVFANSSGFNTALAVTVAAFLAFLCSFAVFKRKPRAY